MSAIGTKRTSPSAPHMSAFGAKRTWLVAAQGSAFDPKRTCSTADYAAGCVPFLTRRAGAKC
jgi:hypothetical protein